MTLLVSVRRLSYPVLIAISALLVVSLYLLSTRGDAVPYLNSVRATTSFRSDIRDNIYNNTLGFEKIFVIGLPSRTDRRDGMVLQAALSNLAIEFIDGVDGKTIPDSAIPSSKKLERVGDATLGAWRAHINAIQEVVRRNLSSALIMEDDADWDVRIRQQMYDLALATHALTQPLSGSSGTSAEYADATYPEAGNGPSAVPDLLFDGLPNTAVPTTSPYGDNWDVIWAGHCGMHFPYSDKKLVPKGRVVRTNDRTVPQHKYLWSIFEPEDLELHYKDHTRVYHHVQEGVCSLAYAVSQKGARRLLHELGLKDANTAFDIELRWFCDGSGNPDRGHHNCLTVQPSLFQIHLPAGPKKSQSDISDHGDGIQEKVTKVLRYSVRMNAEALMDGHELVDQWPDD
ncbi:glycosyltransferase family 25 protein [Hypomontagnella monticulosa]|nr:glycosyltransferase family 25 protein [Hypomontagnella monticulosa]